MTTKGCHDQGMTTPEAIEAHRATLDRLGRVRDEAIRHARRARELAAERRDIIRQLLAAGLSQADIARELGVTRQAIQKMLAV
jgi:DNA-binding NarL/FixJ family response regulator